MTTPSISYPVNIPVGKQPIQICPATGGSVLVYNNDLTNVAFIGYGQSITSANAVPVQPLASVVMDGSASLWGFSLATSVMLTCVPGGTQMNPSPGQIAQQLDLLGLMKDVTGQATNAQLATGVAPFATGIQSYNAEQKGPTDSPFTLHTFGADGRVWAAHLSFALSAGAAHAANDQAFATLEYEPPTGPNQILLIIETAVGGANVADSGDGDLSMPGLQVANTGSLVLNINNGTIIANAVMRASACVLVSFP